MNDLNSNLTKLSPSSRLYGLNVPIIGLTGGIATGKSTVSNILIQKGMPVIDADKLVKTIYSMDSTKDFIRKNYPKVIQDDQISFPALREHFFNVPEAKAKIEKVIYALLPEAFLEAYSLLNGPSYVVYDVPLLFEKNLQAKVDLKVLVYAPREVQLKRIIARDGHHEEMANNILNHQMDIEEKKKKADLIIDNSAGLDELKQGVQNFLKLLFIN